MELSELRPHGENLSFSAREQLQTTGHSSHSLSSRTAPFYLFRKQETVERKTAKSRGQAGAFLQRCFLSPLFGSLLAVPRANSWLCAQGTKEVGSVPGKCPACRPLSLGSHMTLSLFWNGSCLQVGPAVWVQSPPHGSFQGTWGEMK